MVPRPVTRLRLGARSPDLLEADRESSVIDFLAEIPTWVRAVVPTLTAVVGLGTAVTAASRGTVLRKRAEVLRAEIEAASRPHDKEVLQSLHRDVTADIVALLAVPARLRIIALALYLGALALALITGFGLGVWFLVMGGLLTLGDLSPREIGIFIGLLAVLSLLLLASGSSAWLKTGLERIRVAAAYRQGRDVDRKLLKDHRLFPKAEFLEGARESELVTGRGMRWNFRIQVVALSLLPWFLLLLSGSQFAVARNWMALLQWVLSIVFILLVALSSSVGIARAGFSPALIRDEWAHPRPPSPADQIQNEIAAAQRDATSRQHRRWKLPKRSNPRQP